MIVVRIVGGLASQLHKYAVGRALALRHSTALKLDLSWFEQRNDVDTPWEYQLHKYAIRAEKASAAEIRSIQGPALLNRVFDKLERSASWRIPGRKVIKTSFMAPEDFERLPDNIYLAGEWAGDAYFRAYRQHLLTEMQPVIALCEEAQRLLEKIDSMPNSVAVHVRRGDFLSNPHASTFHEITPLGYFLQATESLTAQHPNAQFFLFTDDPTWVEETLQPKLGMKSLVVKGLANHEDLLLMSRCTHTVMSNSGFGWTAAWLNTHPDKQVIAPRRWLKNDTENARLTAHLFAGNWAKLL
ncbi:alpha-1,2-fucosyltransferase [Limnobacter sp.]|uniref:alpha-1,2-fucosyltransferase n=1 Tax=Limnobacter sp. TaxID=2003368 RepID=UPI003514A291